MKLNQKLIKQLRNGEIAVKNSGTVEQLREVLKAAFPEYDELPFGYSQYYSRSAINTDAWTVLSFHHKSKPAFKISDFYQPELFTGWAKDDRFPEWMFYFKDDIGQFGFNAYGEFEDDYNNLGRYSLGENNRPATYEEIEKALIKEAKRRYKLPCQLNYIDTGFGTLEGYSIHYNEKDNSLCASGFGTADALFKDGQWAEIIEQPSQVKPKDKTNPIHYTVDGTTYSLNYQELKAKYESVVNYSDEQFMGNLPEIAHLACIISYFKGLGTQATISDKGIIHELIHLMTDPEEPTNDLQEIREKFNKLIQLV